MGEEIIFGELYGSDSDDSLEKKERDKKRGWRIRKLKVIESRRRRR